LRIKLSVYLSWKVERCLNVEDRGLVKKVNGFHEDCVLISLGSDDGIALISSPNSVKF
jgi:hypothetical protein